MRSGFCRSLCISVSTKAFAADFTGWGWEDVEWAMRVSRRFAVAPGTRAIIAAAASPKSRQELPFFLGLKARAEGRYERDGATVRFTAGAGADAKIEATPRDKRRLVGHRGEIEVGFGVELRHGRAVARPLPC